MRMKKLIILAAAAIAAVACSRSFDTAPAKEQAIGFGTWAETLTKATVENTFDVNDHIGVFGVKTKSTTNTTVFNNVDVKKTAASPETWTYSPKQYWDLNADSYTFFAVSPYAATGYTVDPANGAISASPTITFAGNNSDILVAQKAVVNKTDGTGNFNSYHSVDLVFNHMAALLDVKVKMSADLYAQGAEIKITDVKLLNIDSEGTYKVTGDFTTAPTPVWTTTESAGVYTVDTYDYSEGFVDASDQLNVNISNGTPTIINKLVVLPQTFRTSSTQNQQIQIAYKLKQTGGDDVQYSPEAFDLTLFDNVENEVNTDTAVTGWAFGTHYTYIITIDAHAIDFTASITPWTPESAYNYLVN